MSFSSAGVYTPATGALTAAPGQVIASATWNAINTDYTAGLTQLGEKQLFYVCLTAGVAGANSNTAQPWFPTGVSSFNPIASTAYFFEGHLSLSRTAGTTSHTIGLLFGGTATITSINYAILVSDLNAAASALSTPAQIESAAATTIVVTGASANANQFNTIDTRGLVRINAAGTFIPQFIYSAAPGGAPTVQANSWFRLRRMPSATSSGDWT